MPRSETHTSLRETPEDRARLDELRSLLAAERGEAVNKHAAYRQAVVEAIERRRAVQGELAGN